MRPGRGQYRLWVAAVLVCGMGACAQTVTPAVAQETDLQRVLQRLGETAVRLERSLPSFTCEESVVSRQMRGGRVKRSVTFTAKLRAQRQPEGGLRESFEIATLNGRPFTDGVVDAPVMVSGGFDQAMRYFQPEQQRCFDFQLSPGRLDFVAPASRAGMGCREAGLAGFARLDADGEVTYLERTVPAATAKPLHLATYAEVTLEPVRLGEATYRLSRHMVAEMPQGKSVGRFEATYDHCRLFKAAVKIGPAETVPDGFSASH